MSEEKGPTMTDAEKLVAMYEKVHGQVSRSCHLEAYLDDDNYIVQGLHCLKDGAIAWSVSKTDVLFDYVTRNIKEAKDV